MHDPGNTTTAATNSKPVYHLGSLSRSTALSSSFTAVSSSLDEEGAVEDENYIGREESV